MRTLLIILVAAAGYFVVRDCLDRQAAAASAAAATEQAEYLHARRSECKAMRDSMEWFAKKFADTPALVRSQMKALVKCQHFFGTDE